MRIVPVRTAEAAEIQVLERVENEFRGVNTLAGLIRWCNAQSPRKQVTDIITQDEYTHDVVLSFGDAYLSFDTT